MKVEAERTISEQNRIELERNRIVLQQLQLRNLHLERMERLRCLGWSAAQDGSTSGPGNPDPQVIHSHLVI